MAKDDGFEIGPRGPGEYFFDHRAEKGFYIHRIDETPALPPNPVSVRLAVVVLWVMAILS
jgi:hypothetical protein